MDELFHDLFCSTSNLTIEIPNEFHWSTWNELVLNLQGACFYNCPPSCWTPNFPTHFGLMDNFFLNQPLLTHSSIIKIIINIKSTWKFTYRYMSRAIWRYLDVEKRSKWEFIIFWCVGCSCEGVHPNANFCININDVHCSKSEIVFYVCGKRPFVLTSIT